jgi:hypothetical protein
MATEDISRWSSDPRKRYKGARMQQGRVVTDDDFNEAARIEADDERRTRVDIIGPAGSPDDGFRIDAPGSPKPGEIDFVLHAGAMYVGGLRVEAFGDEHYATQLDWLDQDPAERVTPGATRKDLAYLEVWQQPVEAVEDGELFEPALGSGDTSTRVRTMRRVRLAPGLGDGGCAVAFKQLVDQWQTTHLGTWHADTAERTVNATLKVDFVPGPTGDLCSPSVASGYLGAENQAIRVQIAADRSHFTWGFDNGAPLYRVTAIDSVTLKLVTQPKDQAHWPITGQIVEVLAWSAVLPNGEKLATTTGLIARVAASYDPEAQTLKLDRSIAGFGQAFASRDDAASLGSPYLFLRVWNRGSDVTSDPAIAFATGTQHVLGTTGLRVTFGGDQFADGDHWIIAARPEVPDRIQPWALTAPTPPVGVRRFYAPLGIITWNPAAVPSSDIEDCRPRFPPLTRNRAGCCTLTVGDGVISHGDYTTIQMALDHLPDTGGEICVLPGDYPDAVVIRSNHHHVSIHGCGPRTRLSAADPKAQAVITIDGTHNITITRLRIDAPDKPGILLGASAANQRTQRITLADLVIGITGSPAIFGEDLAQVRAIDVWVEMSPLPEPITGAASTAGGHPAITLGGTDLLVERCRIGPLVPLSDEVTLDQFNASHLRRALGGIQILGGSSRVELRRNRVERGNGNGITLGSISWVDDRGRHRLPWTGIVVEIDCPRIPPYFPHPPTGAQPEADGPVRDVLIVDNEIVGMGRSGIGVPGFFQPFQKADVPVAKLLAREILTLEEAAQVRRIQTFVADRLIIEDNRIRDCVALERQRVALAVPVSWGADAGISLATTDDVVIHRNRIERCGAAALSVCGIYILLASRVHILHNHLLENGPVRLAEVPTGALGGIVMFATGTSLGDYTGTAFMTSGLAGTIENPRALRRSDLAADAARIHGNVVISPQGPALHIVGAGPISVLGNRLISRGATALQITNSASGVTTGAGAVYIANLGRSFESAIANVPGTNRI